MNSTELRIDPRYRSVMNGSGLAGFRALMHEPVGTVIHDHPRRRILRVELAGHGAPNVAFLKRTLREKTKHTVQMLLPGRRPRVCACRETVCARELHRHGFPVMAVMAWGEQRRLGVPRRGFLRAAQVERRPVHDRYARAAPPLRARLARSYGHLLGRLDAAGCFRSVRFKDLSCGDAPDDDACDLPLTLIDRSAVRAWPKRFHPRHCRTFFVRTIGRHRHRGPVLSAEEVAVLSAAYVEAVSPRWPVTAATITALVTADRDAAPA